MKRPIHALLIDDDIPYCSELIEEAKKSRILLQPLHNLEDGISMLEKGRKHKAVILDDRCILEPGHKPGTGKSNFVIKAFDEISRVENEQDRYIPFCVNAIQPDEFSELFAGTTKVFQKKVQHNQMFEWIKSTVVSSFEKHIEMKYGQVFGFIEDFGKEADADYLHDVIRNIEKTDASAIASNLAMIRNLLERLFDILCKKAIGKNPDKMGKRHKSKTKNIISLLYTDGHLPKYLMFTAENIYNIASRFGSHNKLQVLYAPGKHTVKSLLFALFELVEWGDGLMQGLKNSN